MNGFTYFTKIFDNVKGIHDNIIWISQVLKYTDPVISDYIKLDVGELTDNEIYNEFVRSVSRAIYNEVPSYGSVSGTIRATITNRRCYYSKNGFGMSISSNIKDGKLSFIFVVEINKDIEFLKATNSIYYTKLIELGFDPRSIDYSVTKRK